METVRYFLGTKSEIFFCPFPKVLGLEVAVVNSFSPGDVVIVPIFGETGECWAKIAEAFGLSVVRLGGYGGRAPSPEDLRLFLQTRERRTIRGVLVPHVERTTGLCADLAGWSKVCRSFGAFCVAEVGESFGVFPLELEAIGVDLAVVAEPLSFQDVVFFAVTKKAWEARERARCPRFALDFSRLQRWSTREVPSSFVAYLEALRAVGKEAIWERRKHLAKLFYEKVQALGFGIPGEESFPSVAIIGLPEGTKGEDVLSALKERGICAGYVPRRDGTLWIRYGDTLEASEVYGILEVLQRFSV
ncbi:MAG: hypothetical protein ABDK87_03460 [Atribacterota bacterium]